MWLPLTAAFGRPVSRSFTGMLMLTAESLALAHLLPTDRFEATPRLSATAEADQAKFRHSRIDYSTAGWEGPYVASG
jgi:hypothetical protein